MAFESKDGETDDGHRGQGVVLVDGRLHQISNQVVYSVLSPQIRLVKHQGVIVVLVQIAQHHRGLLVPHLLVSQVSSFIGSVKVELLAVRPAFLQGPGPIVAGTTGPALRAYQTGPIAEAVSAPAPTGMAQIFWPP